jgi:hypothetical protein
MRTWIARMRPTPLGWLLGALLVACVVLAIVGSGDAQAAGFIGAVVLVLLLVGAPSRVPEASVARSVPGLVPGQPEPPATAREGVQESSEAAWAQERRRREERA